MNEPRAPDERARRGTLFVVVCAVLGFALVLVPLVYFMYYRSAENIELRVEDRPPAAAVPDDPVPMPISPVPAAPSSPARLGEPSPDTGP